jgi:hypothetical protein
LDNVPLCRPLACHLCRLDGVRFTGDDEGFTSHATHKHSGAMQIHKFGGDRACAHYRTSCLSVPY